MDLAAVSCLVNFGNMNIRTIVDIKPEVSAINSKILKFLRPPPMNPSLRLSHKLSLSPDFSHYVI